MRPRPGLTVATTLAAAITIVMAWPVMVSPAERIFGSEIVGRHYDPLLVMFQMAGSGPSGPYLQPLTDGLGWLLARVLPPVAAYNVLILVTFPLAAAAAYALFRYLFDSHAGAVVAGLAFALAPIHLAHAAYHPHVAQVQWLPLYLLALFAAIDRPSPWRLAGVLSAAAALVLSNDYGGLIGGVLTPIALAAYWWTSARTPRGARAVWIVGGALAAVTLIGVVVAMSLVPRLFGPRSAYAFSLDDVARYSARWRAYVVPPVDHVVFGAWARDVLVRAGVTTDLLEQQLYLGYAMVAAALAAAAAAIVGWRRTPEWRPVLALLIVGVAAAIVSVGSAGQPCGPGSWVIACRLHDVLPMFRAYARFGIVVQLTIAIGAGAAVAMAARRSRAVSHVIVGLLLVVGGFEYWPFPWRAHDVLSTSAHRWVARQPSRGSVLDCGPRDANSSFDAWLMERRVVFDTEQDAFCDSPAPGASLAALGYTYVIARGPRTLVADADDGGVTLAAAFPDSRVYAVTASAPAVAVIATRGFYAYEHGDARDDGRSRGASAPRTDRSRRIDWWRWMPQIGEWTIRNTTPSVQDAHFDLDLESVARPRTMTVLLDGAEVATLQVGVARARYVLGPWRVTPGDHHVTFVTSDAPFRPADAGVSADTRALTIAFHEPL